MEGYNNTEIMEQYRLYVESADKVSQLRANANSFYITVNTLLLAFLGMKYHEIDECFLYVILFAGVLLSIVWFLNIRYYRALNTAKFKVIHILESKLPFQPYVSEWEFLKNGESKKCYVPISHVEKCVPIIFGILYLSIGLMLVFN